MDVPWSYETRRITLGCWRQQATGTGLRSAKPPARGKKKKKKTCCVESLSHRWFSGQKSSVKVRSINLQITFTVENLFSREPWNEGQLI